MMVILAVCYTLIVIIHNKYKKTIWSRDHVPIFNCCLAIWLLYFRIFCKLCCHRSIQYRTSSFMFMNIHQKGIEFWSLDAKTIWYFAKILKSLQLSLATRSRAEYSSWQLDPNGKYKNFSRVKHPKILWTYWLLPPDQHYRKRTKM